MAEFARIPEEETSRDRNKYPKTTYDGQENQSYGFLAAHKLQTGNTRGDHQVRGKTTVVDEQGNTRVLIGYEKGAF